MNRKLTIQITYKNYIDKHTASEFHSPPHLYGLFYADRQALFPETVIRYKYDTSGLTVADRVWKADTVQ